MGWVAGRLQSTALLDTVTPAPAAMKTPLPNAIDVNDSDEPAFRTFHWI
jgi:hypothetical protein